jgi:hypothetical protein
VRRAVAQAVVSLSASVLRRCFTRLAPGGAESWRQRIAVAAGDCAATLRSTLERNTSRLAHALAAVVSLIDLDLTVLGRGISRLAYARVQSAWDRWVFGAGQRAPVRARLVPALRSPAHRPRRLGADRAPCRPAVDRGAGAR